MSMCFYGKGNITIRQQLFRQMRRGGPLEARHVISKFYVQQTIECSFHCLDTASCTAFNVRQVPVVDNSKENCEIANTTEGKMHDHGYNDYLIGKDGNWILYKGIVTISSSSNQKQCKENHCKNGGECFKTNCSRSDCFRCKCSLQYTGKYCKKARVFNSCKEIFHMHSEAKSGIYQIRSDSKSNFTKVYCEMTSMSDCPKGGWTLMMKINGSKNTFNYSSKYWSNKKSYNPTGGQTGFEKEETKVRLYSSLQFREMCLGMEVDGQRNFVFLQLNSSASSLYELIKDETNRPTYLGADRWRSLIKNSSMQRFICKEGFNLQRAKKCAECSRVRLGIIGNESGDCKTPDSFIGFGGQSYSTCDAKLPTLVSCGNVAQCWPDNGVKEIHAFGYIFVR
ncbi:uncharacterized protein LOC114528921 [Dendronephthya gigantea]|uniref:uncharacterized protein LOC114528921 n=1 Tax=Dendronephthya gigantea TaxID=151771 RepID=UPI00106DD00D|nr:uncharacterized protein LOC114528921 [Dendronephthya gigantea]